MTALHHPPPPAPWTARFAARTSRMQRSAVRELLKVAAHSDLISFAGGLPAPEMFPLNDFRAASESVLSRHGPRALQYGETEGTAELRDWIAARHRAPARHLALSRDQVLITHGAQQALDLLGRVLLDPGDGVVVENPTYLAVLSAWRPLDVRFHGVPGDRGGPTPAGITSALRHRPKLLYAIPNFQNPQGTTLDLTRRAWLVENCRAHPLPIVEDDPYGELRYDGEPLPSLLQLDALHAGRHGETQNVIQIGTFSKTLVPGLRLGWVIAPPPVIDQLVKAKQSADLHTSVWSQLVALELAHRGTLDRHLPSLLREYRHRRDAMLAALHRHMPSGVIWTRPDGGMFLLLTLPDPLDAAALLPEALRRKVAYVPGEAFHLDGQGRNTLRLNFTHATPDRIEDGIRRLAEVFKDALQQASPGEPQRHAGP